MRHDEDDDEDEREFRRLTSELSKHPSAYKAKQPRKRFVQVPLWWAEAITKATKTPKAFVGIWLLLLAFRTKNSTFVLPNGQLAACGVNRKTKWQALRDFESAGLILMERRPRKSPKVTLLHLEKDNV
jgi:hypothetical protein